MSRGLRKKMKKNKYSIGAAAKLVGLTEETLRHYDRIGLLHPHEKDTFTGDLDELLFGLQKDYPDAQIVLITPLPNVLRDLLRKSRDYLLPQSAFVRVMKQLGEEHGIPVIDLYNSNFLDTHDAAVIHALMPDGVHGNETGYRMLAQHIAAQLILIEEEEGVEAVGE